MKPIIISLFTLLAFTCEAQQTTLLKNAVGKWRLHHTFCDGVGEVESFQDYTLVITPEGKILHKRFGKNLPHGDTLVVDKHGIAWNLYMEKDWKMMSFNNSYPLKMSCGGCTNYYKRVDLKHDSVFKQKKAWEEEMKSKFAAQLMGRWYVQRDNPIQTKLFGAKYFWFFDNEKTVHIPTTNVLYDASNDEIPSAYNGYYSEEQTIKWEGNKIFQEVNRYHTSSDHGGKRLQSIEKNEYYFIDFSDTTIVLIKECYEKNMLNESRYFNRKPNEIITLKRKL